MKTYFQLLILLILGMPMATFSQVSLERQVTANGGDFASTPGLSLSWTVGEAAVDMRDTPSLMVTEGFQQPNVIITSVPEPVAFPGEIKVFPNPVSDRLHYQVSSTDPLQLQGELYDLTGRRVRVIPSFRVLGEFSGELDVSQLPAGKWLLKFSNGTQVKTFVIGKLR